MDVHETDRHHFGDEIQCSLGQIHLLRESSQEGWRVRWWGGHGGEFCLSTDKRKSPESHGWKAKMMGQGQAAFIIHQVNYGQMESSTSQAVD